MQKSGYLSYYLFGVVCFLLFFGFLVSASISAELSAQWFGKPTYYFFHQLSAVFIACIAGFIFSKLPLNFLRKWSWIFILLNLILMILVFIPLFGKSVGGAYRWLNFKIFTLQPSELLKLTFILYLSALLPSKVSKKGDKKEWASIFFPFLAILISLILLLYFQSDLSTLAVIAIVGIIIYFVFGTPFFHTLFMLLLSVVSFLFFIAFSPYRLKRVLIFLGAIRDPLGFGYQTDKARIAIGSGGIFGSGLEGAPQSMLIPHPLSDSIFAVISEQTGFIGALIVILAYLFLFFVCLKIAFNTSDKFSQLFAIGFASWICIQAFVNISAMVGLVPLTGIPLPFLSYGGSHILAELIGVGILFNILKNVKK